MIIKTQDGVRLINTDNCSEIRILFEDGRYYIYCEYDYYREYYCKIGTYKTAERAHKVLNEIFEKFKGYSTMIMNNYPETTFEMPKD